MEITVVRVTYTSLYLYNEVQWSWILIQPIARFRSKYCTLWCWTANFAYISVKGFSDLLPSNTRFCPLLKAHMKARLCPDAINTTVAVSNILSWASALFPPLWVDACVGRGGGRIYQTCRLTSGRLHSSSVRFFPPLHVNLLTFADGTKQVCSHHDTTTFNDAFPIVILTVTVHIWTPLSPTYLWRHEWVVYRVDFCSKPSRL